VTLSSESDIETPNERRNMSKRSPATLPGYHRGRTPANAGKRYPAEVLTAEEVRRLIGIGSGTSTTGIRNRALIALLYRTGLRLGEALALHPKDLDLTRGTVAVLHGKGGKPRTVGIDAGASTLLQEWLDARGQLRLGPRAPLLCTREGHPLQPSYVRALLPRLAVQAGITKRVHPHGLRHTHAAELALEGFPLNLIQQQLGHSSLATTDRYLAHIAPAQLVRAIRVRSWNP
jgi:site-specific recombinase XerD